MGSVYGRPYGLYTCMHRLVGIVAATCAVSDADCGSTTAQEAGVDGAIQSAPPGLCRWLAGTAMHAPIELSRMSAGSAECLRSKVEVRAPQQAHARGFCQAPGLAARAASRPAVAAGWCALRQHAPVHEGLQLAPATLGEQLQIADAQSSHGSSRCSRC